MRIYPDHRFLYAPNEFHPELVGVIFIALCGGSYHSGFPFNAGYTSTNACFTNI